MRYFGPSFSYDSLYVHDLTSVVFVALACLALDPDIVTRE